MQERIRPAFQAVDRAHLSSARKPGLEPTSTWLQELRGSEGEWRIRIGDYRVIYTIDDSRFLVEVTRIRHRREVYEP